ncbi:Hsp70 family protein [Cryptosporangium aurantiacum]|uniref:Hsp70 protein n=1 Tax=Cryptosporangium aurantiacum TaxID=134849 RepID=A0A1M7K3A3_9ACTN|nr:Hsp70 family protein [Cryptosporangium aurantiacum]SHM59307.1 Hsp70 protein [Cryptosporangium aurantiacum]
MTRRARLGIDFGTAHTVAVLRRSGREPRLLLFDGSPLLPSAVHAGPDGRLLTGRDAQHAGLTAPGAFEPHPKRCVDDRTVLLGDHEIAVSDLIAAVLRRVADEAAQALGEPPDEAVLTYPAAWANTRRGTLLTAASEVLPNVRLLPEPVAAAHHFAEATATLAPGESALVYDFGAGTFDASVVRRTPTGYEVLASEGLPDCGGLDVDAAIIANLGTVAIGQDATLWARLTSPETTSDQRYRRQLWDNVRTAKEVLSRATSTYVHLPLFDRDEVLGREQFEALVAPIVERTLTACRAALRTADVSPTAIYLTGGSSRIPAVATALHQRFDVVPTLVDQPEIAVAEGAVTADESAGPVASPAPPTPPADRSGRPARRRLAVFGAAAVVLSVLAVAGLARIGDDDRDAKAAPTPSASTSIRPVTANSPTPSYAPGVDPCLVGSWRRVQATVTVKIDGVDVVLRGTAGRTLKYGPDGVLTVTYDDPPLRGTYRGNEWVYRLSGRSTLRYRTANGTLFGTTQSVNGRWSLYRDGVYNNGGALQLNPEPDRYACIGDTLTSGGDFYSDEFVRVR